MKKREIFILAMVAVTSALLMTSVSVAAAEYPDRPITVVVPYAPGGSVDFTGRTFAAFAEKVLGQPVVVVNKTGASGMVGTEEVAKSTPDGHTLIVGCTHNVTTIEWEIANGRKPAANKDDFVLLGSISLSPNLIVVPYDSPWKTLADMIKDCKAKPDHYALGHGGL